MGEQMSIGVTVAAGLSKVAKVENLDKVISAQHGYFIPTTYPIENGPQNARCSLLFTSRHNGLPIVRIRISSDDLDSRVDLVPLRSRLQYRCESTLFGAVHVPARKVGDVWEFRVLVTHTLPLYGLREEVVTAVVTDMLRMWQESVMEATSYVGEQHDSEEVDELSETLSDIDSLVGLQSVKDFMHALVARRRFDGLRHDHGLPVTTVPPHLVFTGDPGTGKTTVARLFGRLYQGLGWLEKGHVVEVGRGDLVGGYIGQTALKTQKVCESALGGVLFIDEAYSLFGCDRDFGSEAVTTLLAFMENNRGKIAVIMAGYPTEMEQLLDSNAGLRSRFDTTVAFDNFTADELFLVFMNQLHGQEFSFTYSAVLDIIHKIRKDMEGDRPVNARSMRTMADELVTRHAVVTGQMSAPTLEQLRMITSLSVPKAWGEGRELVVAEFGDLG
jgi:AAA+ superfamily predicted ATPase